MFKILFIISIVATAVFTFGIVNTMVSMKYEIADPSGCISSVTGDNLCIAVKNLKFYALLSFVISVVLGILKHKKLFLHLSSRTTNQTQS